MRQHSPRSGTARRAWCDVRRHEVFVRRRKLDALELDMARFDFVRGIGDGAFSIANPLGPTRCQDRLLAGLATLVVSAGAKILGRAHASGIASPQFPHQVGTTRSIPQTPQPFLFEAPLPFVAVLATDPQPPTQPRHALLGLKSQLHKLQPSRR